MNKVQFLERSKCLIYGNFKKVNLYKHFAQPLKTVAKASGYECLFFSKHFESLD